MPLLRGVHAGIVSSCMQCMAPAPRALTHVPFTLTSAAACRTAVSYACAPHTLLPVLLISCHRITESGSLIKHAWPRRTPCLRIHAALTFPTHPQTLPPSSPHPLSVPQKVSYLKQGDASLYTPEAMQVRTARNTHTVLHTPYSTRVQNELGSPDLGCQGVDGEQAYVQAVMCPDSNVCSGSICPGSYASGGLRCGLGYYGMWTNGYIRRLACMWSVHPCTQMHSGWGAGKESAPWGARNQCEGCIKGLTCC